MNPLILLLPAGLVLWYLSQGGEKKKKQKAQEPEQFVPRVEEYLDRNKVIWNLSNPSPDVWKAKVKNDPSGYPGYQKAWEEDWAFQWQPTATNRADLVNKIDYWLTVVAGADIRADAEDGDKNGREDGKASVQAYNDSLTGIGVKPIYKRWNATKNQAWKDAYARGFASELTRVAMFVDEKGNVSKAPKYSTENFWPEFGSWLKSFK